MCIKLGEQLIMEKFKTIEEHVTQQIIEKKSKFIANIFYVETMNEVDDKILEIKKKYYDAKHNCYACVILDNKGNKIQRSSDDGEPRKNSWNSDITNY